MFILLKGVDCFHSFEMLLQVISQIYPERQEYGRDFHSVACEERKGKAVETFVDLSSNLITAYLFAFAFSSLFNLQVLNSIPILFDLLFAAFIILLLERISVFRSRREHTYYCGITMEHLRVQLLANQMEAGSWKRYDSEARKRECKVTFHKTARQLKERNFNPCSFSPNANFYPREKKVVLSFSQLVSGRNSANPAI